jgi:hypothetical protein
MFINLNLFCKSTWIYLKLPTSAIIGGVLHPPHPPVGTALWGPPVANVLVLYNWGSRQFAQWTRKMFMVNFAGGPQVWGPPVSGHPGTRQLRHWALSVKARTLFCLISNELNFRCFQDEWSVNAVVLDQINPARLAISNARCAFSFVHLDMVTKC